MDALSTAEYYFSAWNSRDPEAIVAMFVPGGTYEDPVSGRLMGKAIGEYARGLFDTFPDLSFEIASAASTTDTSVAAEWIMRGTNSGSMQGAPPTGKSIELTGSDFVQTEDGRIRAVRGYFDSGAIPRQLGMQVIVQPESIGPVQFGTSVYMNTARSAQAGAVSVTILQTESEGTKDMVRDYTRQVMGELPQTPGFISFLAATAGQRMFTVTAWEDEESPRALLKEGVHRQAMKSFFTEPGIRGGVTSVFTPGRIGVRWSRCESCGKMMDTLKRDGHCECSAELPVLLYW